MNYSEELLIFIQTRINQLSDDLSYILDMIKENKNKDAELLTHVAKADFAILKLLLPILHTNKEENNDINMNNQHANNNYD